MPVFRALAFLRFSVVLRYLFPLPFKGHIHPCTWILKVVTGLCYYVKSDGNGIFRPSRENSIWKYADGMGVPSRWNPPVYKNGQMECTIFHFLHSKKHVFGKNAVPSGHPFFKNGAFSPKKQHSIWNSETRLLVYLKKCHSIWGKFGQILHFFVTGHHILCNFARAFAVLSDGPLFCLYGLSSWMERFEITQ